MRKIVTATFLTIALVYGCIQGSMWQYDRYQVRHANNELIKSNSAKAAVSEGFLSSSEPKEIAWRTITMTGKFIPTQELLIRNRYHDGKYGFGVMTIFQSKSGVKYWVDRGWVIAGANAQTPPATQKVTDALVEITARIRIENIENQIRGSVFAAPGSKSGQLEKWNVQAAVDTADQYLDLISSSNESFTPEVPAQLPEISDGPHLAYSFQWLIFGFLVILAWFLVVREERRSQAEKL